MVRRRNGAQDHHHEPSDRRQRIHRQHCHFHHRPYRTPGVLQCEIHRGSSYSKDKIEHALEIIAGIQSAKKDYGKMSDDIDDGDSNGWGRKQAKQDNTSIDDMDLDELV